MHRNHMANRTKLFEDDGRIFFQGNDPDTVVHFFKDDALIKEESLPVSGKGAINNQLSERLHQTLQDLGIPTTFIRRLNMREQLHSVGETMPVRIRVHNYTDLDVNQDYGVDMGTKLPYPILEFVGPTQHKTDKLITPELAEAFGWISNYETEDLKILSRKINDIIFGFFRGIDYDLIDITLDFARMYKDEFTDPILLFAGELTPETCSLRSRHTLKATENSVENLMQFYQDMARISGIIKDSD
jgi:phosphoribosylaminoimidazole-succinocarboxamide synthase